MIYRAKGTVVGVYQPSVATPEFGEAIDEARRVPTGRVRIDVDLDGGGLVQGFPWGLADEPRVGARVMLSIEDGT